MRFISSFRLCWPIVFPQVIAAASKPPEVDPFLQDYMDDMDQNLILCRYSSFNRFCQIILHLRNIGKRPKYWY